jgi:HD superfamily phosphohydrolase
MLLARYFMYMQLYFHHVRRIYDIHLKDFLKAWLSDGYLPVALDDHLKLTDNEVTTELQKAARDEKHPGHDPARRIVKREHFRLLYHRNPDDLRKNPDAAEAIFDAACNKFGGENVRYDSYEQKRSVLDFPILDNDGRIVSSQAKSVTLKNVPIVAVDYIFISPKYRKTAEDWLKQNREIIITQKEEDEL